MKILKLKTILIILGLGLVIWQFFPIDKENPTVNPNDDFFEISSVPDDVKLLIKNACKDCHSNLTVYPWYTNIQPFGKWIKGHIDFGRKNLNFSEWNAYEERRRNRKIEECIEVLEDKRMPMKSYTFLHGEAKLTEEQNERLVAFFQSLK